MTNRVLAYCGLSMFQSAKQVIGADPLTSPPLDYSTFPIERLFHVDHLYLDLHGEEGGSELFEIYKAVDNPIPQRITALTEEQILGLGNLSGLTVFGTTCYIPETPVMVAFLRVGANVIGGKGSNYSADKGLAGASKLARYYFNFTSFLSPEFALTAAKQMYKIYGSYHENEQVVKDTLEFQLYEAKYYPFMFKEDL